MKKMLLFAVVALALGVTAVAQDSPAFWDVYQLNYFSNRNNSAGADSVTRIVNPGTQGTPIGPDHGTICADIYMFDSTQEMLECCHCPITANGVLQLSLLNDLMQDPLTGFPAPNDGVIKIVSDDGANCNEQAPRPVRKLLAWQTHIQEPTTGTFVTTEDHFLEAPLTYTRDSHTGELDFLGQACSFVQYLGSGKGVCNCADFS